MRGNGFRPINICLYVALPRNEEDRKYVEPWTQRLRSLIKHTANQIATKVLGRLLLDVYHYMTLRNLGDNSNRGDIAIRLAIRQQLSEAFAPRPVNFTEVSWPALTDDVVE